MQVNSKAKIYLKLVDGFVRKEFVVLMEEDLATNLKLEYAYDDEKASAEAKKLISKNFAEKNSPEDYCFLGAFEQETNIEMGGVFIFFDRKLNIALGDTMIVYPEFRGRGIARQIMDLAVIYMRKEGVKTVGIGVRHENKLAANLYIRNGYKAILLYFEKWL